MNMFGMILICLLVVVLLVLFFIMCLKNKENDDDKAHGMAIDEQTGKEFIIQKEKMPDSIAANISMGYSLIILLFLLWLLFDIWSKGYRFFSFIPLLVDSNKDAINSTTFRLVAFTFIGGCLGGTINSIRAIINWHCEKDAFGCRFFFKHISLPWIGGTLALFIYAIVRSGIGMLGGDLDTNSGTTLMRQTLSLFAFGVLSGYGSHQAFIWIDFQVNRIFRTVIKPKVPNLIGRTQKEADAALAKVGLKIGTRTERPVQQHEKVDTIVEQNPTSGISVEGYKEVDIKIAK
jgi:hypothetical protein